MAPTGQKRVCESMRWHQSCHPRTLSGEVLASSIPVQSCDNRQVERGSETGTRVDSSLECPA